jgi:hypothetical protein
MQERDLSNLIRAEAEVKLRELLDEKREATRVANDLTV